MAAITIAVVETAFCPPCNFQDEVATNMTTNVNGWPTMEIQRAICLRLFIRRAIWQNHLVMTSDPLDHSPMAGQGSAGNVIAALCSFFHPGAGTIAAGPVTHGDYSVRSRRRDVDRVARMADPSLVDP